MNKVRIKKISDIKGLEIFTNYSVTSDGQVFNTKTGKRIQTKKDYLQVTLSKGKINKTIYIHQLVARAFIGEPPTPDRYCIDHIDRDRYNNNVENLRYVTHKENSSNTSFIKHNNKKVQILAVDMNTLNVTLYDSIADASRNTNTHYTSIQKVLGGTRITSNGYKFFKL